MPAHEVFPLAPCLKRPWVRMEVGLDVEDARPDLSMTFP
jgi:hypothetical protein